MLNPNEIEFVPNEIMKLFRTLELDVLSDLAERIAVNMDISRAADWEIYRLYELGVAKEVIKRHIRRALRLSGEEIDRIYDNILAEDYARYEPIYRQAGKSFIPYRENKQLQQLVSGMKEQTKGEFKNITQSLGFAVKNADGTNTFLPAAKFYQKTLDNAAAGMLSGVYDYNTVIKRAVKEMTGSGLRAVDYFTEQGDGTMKTHTNRVEVAARRALMTGFNQVVAKITEENAEQLGTDHFEVTYHRGARPTHQPWQGRVYTKDELVTVCGYGDVAGLKGANCYHDFHLFFPGISKRLYTDEELDRMNAEENTPKKYGDKEYTVYEALQRQRRIETALRKKREEISLLEKGGANEDDILAAKAKYHALSSEYSQFSKAMNLPQQRERISIDGRKGVDVSFGTQTGTNDPKQTISSEPISKNNAQKEDPPINGVDVKAEYDKNATPGKGNITYDDNYDKAAHKIEIDFADWLHEKYGGKIHLLEETNKNNIKTPDYLWNSQMWDLKCISSEEAADSAIRKGYKQIIENPGGLFLNCGENEISFDVLHKIIHKRAIRCNLISFDVMVISKGEVIEVLRYKK